MPDRQFPGSELRQVVLHELVALWLQAHGDGPAPGGIDAGVALGVDAKRHRLAPAEEFAGVLRLGERQLIVKGHAAVRPLRPQSEQRLQRDHQRRTGCA